MFEFIVENFKVLLVIFCVLSWIAIGMGDNLRQSATASVSYPIIEPQNYYSQSSPTTYSQTIILK